MSDCVDAICTDFIPQPVFYSNSFTCLSARNPDMMKLENCLETFDSPNWPSDRITSTPFNFAASVFYYLGDQDRVKCWYCNGGIKNWENNDVVSEEHAKWYPLREFLLRRQSVQYVKSVLQKYPDLIRPSITNPTKAVEEQCLIIYLKNKLRLPPLSLFLWKIQEKMQKLKIEEEMRNDYSITFLNLL